MAELLFSLLLASTQLPLPIRGLGFGIISFIQAFLSLAAGGAGHTGPLDLPVHIVPRQLNHSSSGKLAVLPASTEAESPCNLFFLLS